MPPRWKKCVNATRTTLRDTLTEEYVARYFPPASREAFAEMFAAFVSAFDERLDELAWMDEPTRSNARTKLSMMKAKIGHPERFEDHSFPIGARHHAENSLVPILELARQRFARVGGAVDRAAWHRNPLDTNAFVDNLTNTAVFPAAILQPPFLSPKATVPVNFGSIGFHLGHEMTHAFDNSGARYDGSGNLKDWWSPGMWKRFEEKTRCLQVQYAAYEPVPGIHVDGKMTLGENVADLGGLKLAFRAYRKARNGAKEVTVAGGYSEDQQFFLSHAQGFCVKFGEKDLRRFLETNVHAPHWLRVNGVVKNLPEFAAAWGCKVPEATCEVW
jgi:putative endopeptidase